MCKVNLGLGKAHWGLALGYTSWKSYALVTEYKTGRKKTHKDAAANIYCLNCSFLSLCPVIDHRDRDILETEGNLTKSSASGYPHHAGTKTKRGVESHPGTHDLAGGSPGLLIRRRLFALEADLTTERDSICPVELRSRGRLGTRAAGRSPACVCGAVCIHREG